MILMGNRNREILAIIYVLDIRLLCEKEILLLFLFCSQFSTPCSFMATSKSGVKILIAPLLAVWRFFFLSSICKENSAEWLKQTS